MNDAPSQGDVLWVDPEPTRGSEQAKARPFVVVSVDEMNRSPLRLVLAVPVTRTDRGHPLHVRIDPPEGGLDAVSFALPEHMRSLSQERVARRLGTVRPITLESLLKRCRLLLRDPR